MEDQRKKSLAITDKRDVLLKKGIFTKGDKCFSPTRDLISEFEAGFKKGVEVIGKIAGIDQSRLTYAFEVFPVEDVGEQSLTEESDIFQEILYEKNAKEIADACIKDQQCVNSMYDKYRDEITKRRVKKSADISKSKEIGKFDVVISRILDEGGSRQKVQIARLTSETESGRIDKNTCYSSPDVLSDKFCKGFNFAKSVVGKDSNLDMSEYDVNCIYDQEKPIGNRSGRILYGVKREL